MRIRQIMVTVRFLLRPNLFVRLELCGVGLNNIDGSVRSVDCAGLSQFAVSGGKNRAIQAKLGSSISGGSKGRAFDEMEAQRVRAPSPNRSTIYKSPCDRKRVTGSTTGTACRRKIQRATAKPIAA